MTPVERSVILQKVADILEQNLGSGVSRPTRKQQSNFICEEKKVLDWFLAMTSEPSPNTGKPISRRNALRAAAGAVIVAAEG